MEVVFFTKKNIHSKNLLTEQKFDVIVFTDGNIKDPFNHTNGVGAPLN